MRKLISSIVLIGTTILMLLPVQPLQPVQRVQALPAEEVYFTVRYTCIVSRGLRRERSWESGTCIATAV